MLNLKGAKTFQSVERNFNFVLVCNAERSQGLDQGVVVHIIKVNIVQSMDLQMTVEMQ